MSEPGSKRGRTHDAEGAREAILNAAEQVFAEHGFDGARIDTIAKVASYNKSLIFQYFGDKLGLYNEVIRRADDQTRELQTIALAALTNDAPHTPEQISELLRQFVGWYFDYLVEHPQILRIYMWEMAEGWQSFAKIVSQRDFDDIDQFGPVLVALQNAGLLWSDLNPIVQLVPAMFSCHTFLALLPIYRILMPAEDLSSKASLAKIREFVVEFVIRGLLRTPAEARRPQAG